MRILVLTSVYPPLGYSGHDERCRQTVRALARRGHQVQVLTSDYRLPPMGVDGDNGVFRELHLHSATGGDSAVGSSYSATLAHERYNAESVDYRIRRFKPDFVYVWNMRDLSKSILFRLEKSGLSVVYDLHGDWYFKEHFNQDPWFCWWFANDGRRSGLLKKLNQIIGRTRKTLGLLPIGEMETLAFKHSYVASKWLKSALSDAGLSGASDLPVMYPCIDQGILTEKTDYIAKRHFMWAGLLSGAKAPDVAVDAVGLLKERGVDVQLDLFGMGEPKERKAKRERIVANGLSDRVTMQGIRPGELAQYYPNYDALLYTNRTAEPFSMTVLEAMLSGLPCLVSDVGGNAELIEHGVTGLLYEPDSAEALADAIEDFLMREDGGAALAKSQIKRLQTERSIETFCEHLEAFLTERSIGSGR